jgi:DNA-binding MarR family transcriptional regulator
MANHSLTKQAQVALLLAAVRRRQRQSVEARAGRLGLSSQQFWILEAIGDRGECALCEILATLPMDQPTASRVLAALQAQSLIKVDSDPDDRRRRTLRLTARGSRVARQCRTIAKEVRTAIVAGFSQDELGRLGSYLRRLVDNLDHLDEVSPPPGWTDARRGLAKSQANAN